MFNVGEPFIYECFDTSIVLINLVFNSILNDKWISDIWVANSERVV